MVSQELNIPIEIANDNYLRAYKVMEKDKVVKYFERRPDPRDQKPVFERGELSVKPVFLGGWEDHTSEYLAKEQEKKARLKAEKKAQQMANTERVEEDHRSGRVRTREEIREEELRRAEELLEKLWGASKEETK